MTRCGPTRSEGHYILRYGQQGMASVRPHAHGALEAFGAFEAYDTCLFNRVVKPSTCRLQNGSTLRMRVENRRTLCCPWCVRRRDSHVVGPGCA